MKKGFTLVELIMIIVILGILSAVAIPLYRNLAADAKKAAAKGVIGGIRSALSIDYAENALNGDAAFPATLTGAIFADGKIPESPVDESGSPRSVVAADEGDAVDGTTAYMYDSATGAVWFNTTGEDSDNVSWSSY